MLSRWGSPVLGKKTSRHSGSRGDMRSAGRSCPGGLFSFPGAVLTGPSQAHLSGEGSWGWKRGNRREAPLRAQLRPSVRFCPRCPLTPSPGRAVSSSVVSALPFSGSRFRGCPAYGVPMLSNPSGASSLYQPSPPSPAFHSKNTQAYGQVERLSQ